VKVRGDLLALIEAGPSVPPTKAVKLLDRRAKKTTGMPLAALVRWQRPMHRSARTR
jgi:hypothetical protein